ncbi:MAG TPA: oxidoreductase [Clostridia bacterium]|nr:oxidoreductase [Clostridia bacterium]
MVKDHRLFQLRFEDPKLNDEFTHKPGQFVMLSVLGVGEIPVSLCSSPSRKGIMELMVRKVGRVTSALYALRENDFVGIRGPYGNGFPVDDMKGKDLVIVAGGLGTAPLRGLLWYCLDNRAEFGKIALLYGSRSTKDMLFRSEMESLLNRDDIQCLLSVEKLDDEEKDTWRGYTGLVTDLFRHLGEIGEDAYAAVCGPPVMYKYVLEELLNKGFDKNRILMSLERRMKCGIGKCAHCAIGYHSSVGYRYVCIHGPIFTYWDATNLPEMI